MLFFEDFTKINESYYDMNRKINLLQDILKVGWNSAIKNLSSVELPYWTRFFKDELKVGLDLISTLREVFKLKSKIRSNRIAGKDLWKYQMGKNPKNEYKNKLRYKIQILDRITLKYKDKMEDWLANNKNQDF